MNWNWGKSLISKAGISIFLTLAVLMLLVGSEHAAGQACSAQNWAATTPNIWAATVSDLVMLNNNPTTNQPTIPTMLYDGTYSPWGYSKHPAAVTQLNTNWSCPSGTPTISVAGAGRETVAFQLFITASAAAPLGNVSVTITPLSGPGATLTSDNTGTSEVTRFLEGYVPYSCTGALSIGCVQASGSIPDPLIPFYDPYDSGNPAVATPFNVQPATTQGVWVNITIPANQTAGTYTGTLTVSGTGISTATIPVNVTVWNGNLPAFDAGSIDPSYADMLKVWLPLYQGSLDSGEGVSGSDIPLFQKYQVMAHNYDIDTQFDPIAPSINGAYPSTNPTSFTTDGTASTIDWTAYDSYFGPSLTPGALFSDGTAMRVLDSPIANGGAGAWNYPHGYNWCMYNCGNAPLMPDGLVSLTQNYATQISQHFSSNHTSRNWAIPDLLSYTFDENYNVHSYQLADQKLMYQIISQVDQAINASNSSLSPTWAASTAPIRTLMTDEPACMEQGDTPYYTDDACADHLNLSYPGGALATPGYSTSWVTAWSPGPGIYMTGQPGPPLSYGWTVPPVIITGTGYQYTLDLTQGVPALSTAPAPIERWTYNNGGGGAGGIYRRLTYWAAYKYGQDVTVPSVGDPNPATPAPGGIWSWIGNFWGGYNGAASASACNSLSPFVANGDDQGDSYLFPGNELGCYFTANPVGKTVLTSNPAVNSNCTSNNYSVCNGISGPIATRELEQWRRGYEDYEYLYLYGKQAGRAAAEKVVASIAAEGLADWEGYDWENIDGGWYEYGVSPVGTSYTGNCTYPNPINSPIFGNLPNGLPNGPTGQGSSGDGLNYNPCEGLWSPDPYAYESARIQLAEALGFAPPTIPEVTSLVPSSDLNTGGKTVQIFGANFIGATAVQFGGVDALSFTIESSSLITAVTPPGNGTVQVQVFAPGGANTSDSSSQYTYVSPVTVTGLNPSQGIAAGGNTVAITGTDFSAGATVMFGSTPATNVVVTSSTGITCIAPAGSGAVDVTVTAAEGTSAMNPSDLYTYLPPPTVNALSPSNGPITGGTSVTVTGAGFSVSGLTVLFGGNHATNVNVSSDTSLTATSPAGSSMNGGAVDVTVTTADGTSPTVGADQFTYNSPVTVTGLNVQTGPPAGGTSVVITGTGFTGATVVKFGGNAAPSFAVNSATQITATSPAGGGTVDITVTTPPYSSAPVYADQFSYFAAVAGGVFATLPTTAVGSTSSSQNVQITLASASAIGSITVPPAQNGKQDFTVGTVTGCSVGGSSNPASTVCTVPVTFSPQYPGIRTGALTINYGGAVIGTVGLAGIGQGPEVAVSPGSLTMAIGGGTNGVTATPQSVTTAALSDTSNFAALAMDGGGNLYIADYVNGLAYKVNAATNQIVAVAGNYTFANGAVPPSTTPEPALGAATSPIAIAVDGAGNVYLVDANIDYNDPNNGAVPGVVEEVSAATGEIAIIAGNPNSTVMATTTPQPALNVFIDAANSLATDAAGNLYIADFFNNMVEMVTPDGNIVVVAGGGGGPSGPYATPQAATSVTLNGPTGMVVDASGNLYISDQNINLIEMVNPAGQIVTVAGGGSNLPTTAPQSAFSVGFNAPGGLAVDGAGDLYIADILNNEVEELNLAGQVMVIAGGGGIIPTATAQSSLTASLGNIEGVEVDGAGNLYIADGQDIGGGDNMIEKVTPAGAPLNFPFTDVGSQSLPQSLTLTNIGNLPLTLSSVTSPADYPLQTTGTCTATATSGQSLASSNNCSLTFVFDPTNLGVLDESATLNDNNLNAVNAQQALSFTGIAPGGTVATPTFSVGAGTYTSVQTVSISDTTAGAAIYYTTNGTTPTTSSTLATSPVIISSSETLQAIAAATGYINSAVASAPYVINIPVAATPTFSPGAGTYTSIQTVTISDTTPGAAVYYTTNGTTPTTSSTLATGSPVTVSSSETLQAIAIVTGYTNSAVASAPYVINLPLAATPGFSPGAGTYASVQTVTISDTINGAAIYYTTDGTAPTTSSTLFTSAIVISSSETLRAIAAANGYSNSAVASAPYVLTLAPAVEPTVLVTPSPYAITTTQALTVTVGVSGGVSSPIATGSVTLTSGTYSSVATTLVSGSAQIDIPAGSLPVGTDMLTATYMPDPAGSASYLSNNSSAPVTVTVAVPASFTISGSAISVFSGATTGNTSTITVTPANGFTGTVGFSCAITPAAAAVPATCSILPTSITISGTTAQTATLTVNTSGTTSSLNKTNKLFWPSTGGAALALALLFGIPARRRNWRTMLGMVLLLVAICGAVSGCGGTTKSNSTTTPGAYTVTITGTSGATTSKGTASLTVL